MKNRNLILSGLAACFIAFAAAPSWAAHGETVHVKVRGLVCDFCARAVEKVFINTGDVGAVDVDLNAALITVEMKEGKYFSDEAITAHVTNSGYNVENIHRQPPEPHNGE